MMARKMKDTDSLEALLETEMATVYQRGWFAPRDDVYGSLVGFGALVLYGAPVQYGVRSVTPHFRLGSRQLLLS